MKMLDNFVILLRRLFIKVKSIVHELGINDVQNKCPKPLTVKGKPSVGALLVEKELSISFLCAIVEYQDNMYQQCLPLRA